jgi:hypothetical protein
MPQLELMTADADQLEFYFRALHRQNGRIDSAVLNRDLYRTIYAIHLFTGDGCTVTPLRDGTWFRVQSADASV